ncbi:MAG: hypothetical protein KBG28_25185 [Kofleriaceae bacterium]|jgi:hypothetical protein|nr:hypothetical protein [Kofleriaceae bacterium]MBP6838327.1 hypothetical protein [Kofleriaceae bacterium]MBP9207288.1 hypothetical protein [Kofleriaceae bacterium]
MSTRLALPPVAVVGAVALGLGCRGPRSTTAPRDLVRRELSLPLGHAAATLAVEASISSRTAGAPISVAPAAEFGVAPDVTVGVGHGTWPLGVVSAGGGLCLTGRDHGCPQPYANLTLDARWQVRPGDLALAPRARFVVEQTDPFLPGLALGALARWTGGRFAVETDPHLVLGLLHRDLGNRSRLRVPVLGSVQPTRGWAIGLRTGVDGELATFSETFAVPVALESTVRVTPAIDLWGGVGFRALLGPQNQFRDRALSLAVRWRWAQPMRRPAGATAPLTAP